MKELLQNKEYRFFLSTRVLLTIALQIQAVVIGWEIYSLTRDPLSLGLIGLAEAIPAISVALYAGHLADISSKRKILLSCLLLLICCSMLLWWITSETLRNSQTTTTLVNSMYAVIFISGVARGFYAPASFSFLPQLVHRDQLTKAATLNSSSWQIAAIIGPVLAGFLYASAGVQFTLLLVLLLMLLAFISMWQIAPKPIQDKATQDTIFKRLHEGISFVFKNKVILGALSLDLFAVLFGGAVALLPVFADEILHAGPQGLGVLRAAPSIGAALTMLWLSFRKSFQQPGVTLLWCVAGFGACMVGFGLSHHFYLSVLLLFLSGAFDSVSVVVRSNILQLSTPDHMRGRVSAVNSMFIGSSNEIGAFESGVAARLMGTVPSVVFGGCMTLLITSYTAWKGKQLRRFTYD